MNTLKSLFLLPLCGLFFTGCVATMDCYRSEEAVTLQTEVRSTQSLDIPVRFFDEDLPSRYQYKGLGIINDQETFLKLWNSYAKEATALPPSVDFRDYVLIFVYDPNYYNHVEIVGLNVWQGIANPIIRKTDWKLSIGGNPTMRKIREAEGAILPEPKVNVAFQQVPRHRRNRSGVTALLVEGNADEPGKSRVIPIPDAP